VEPFGLADEKGCVIVPNPSPFHIDADLNGFLSTLGRLDKLDVVAGGERERFIMPASG
jgi:hypothetical protein